ncbi:hypothetical protein QNI19_36710 [Cytophagaceae bacterium DM2B3-1]|uniref:ZU5 domain-containing protein n=1 Tax=Xanthocytophaga flava TaxID=3048013 RepID=A0ABT7CY02_9BACT|nr:hypothetical protein [Xanthocytophaga flavus]MDJ1498536.1 hypothetical protein [Xanthocytophaga flavus]
MKRVFYVLLMSSLLLCNACKTSDPEPVATKTEVGEPTGTATTASIGAAGGSITSADGLVKLDIPAGALAANTTISVQPITNNAPLGIGGIAYRFTPDGQQFNQPVKVTFKYTSDLLAGADANVLWIVTQAADGSWQALLKSNVNTTTKTITGEITHFSDWGLGKFIDVSLDPASAYIKPKESVQLKVSGFIASTNPDDELAPLVPINPKSNDDALELLTPIEKRTSLFKQVKWTLAGEGTLTANGWTATYTAPSETPSKNPVAVSVEMERYQDGQPAQLFSKVLLVSNITIAEEGVVVVNFNGTEYKYKQSGDANQVAYVVVQNEYVVWQGASSTGIPNFTFYRSLIGTGSHSHNCQDAADIVSYTASPTLVYQLEWCDDEGTCHCAPFTSTISEFGNGAGKTIAGTFSGSLYNADGELFPISGYFNVKRIN